MSAGSKLSLAIIVLFAVLLGVYYGFGGPGLGDGPRVTGPTAATSVVVDDLEGLPAVTEPVAQPTPQPQKPVNPGPQWGPGPVESQAAETDSPGIRIVSFQEPPKPNTAASGGGDGTSFYTVRAEDSMWTIAQKWLGSGARWEEIARLNGGLNPDRLDVGMKLRMPPKTLTKQGSPPEQAPAAITGKVHTVAKGDTLATIASRYLGSGSRWEAIHKANRDVIGADPHRLKIGMKLKIPE
ncbi:MAG: LysM peptidoglycan-binding domain-containing protein [Planctomycetota bacterium]|jgi:nucleoid-associated protein YgaU